jgi:hypothetical protein
VGFHKPFPPLLRPLASCAVTSCPASSTAPRGPGPDAIGQFGLPAMKESDASHNVIHALEDWVEQNKAPGNHRDQIC